VLCVMCYVLCVMCYVLCVMCYVLCVMCYVLCVMCYVLCVMCYVLRVSIIPRLTNLIASCIMCCSLILFNHGGKMGRKKTAVQPLYPDWLVEMVGTISHYFDNPNKAMQILFFCLKYERYEGNQEWIIVDRDGDKYDLREYAQMHQACYERRQRHNTPHKINILELELLVPRSPAPSLQASGGRKPNLDQLEGNVEEYF